MHSQTVQPQPQPQPQAHSYEHQAGEDENEHQHEKKSVLKKVKAKAKKIKDTLKSHGQSQGHHDQEDHNLHGHHDQEDHNLHDQEDHNLHGHHDQEDHNLHDTPDDHDLDEEDDDEEMAIDPEIHGASGLDSTYVPEQDSHEAQGTTDLLKSSLVKQEEDQGNKVRTSNIKDVPNPIQSNYSLEEEAKPEIGLRNSVRFEEDPDAPKTRSQQLINPANYQTKVPDPTAQGTKEIEASSIPHKLGQMSISEESKPGEEFDSRQHDQSIFPTGSHDQFSPEPTPPLPILSDEVPQSLSHKSNASKSEDKGPLQSSYTQKISSAASSVADKAIYAKNVVASKLGYGERDDAKEHDEQEKSKATSQGVYGKKIVEKFTPVYEKVVETGSNLMPKAKAHGTRSPSQIEGQDKGVSVRDYFKEKLKPGEEDRALSEVISGALHNKQKRDETEKTEKKLGEVMESEEVKKRLGSTDENSEETDVNRPGGVVASKIKEVVGSPLGEGEETRSSSQHTPGSNDSGGFPGSLG